MKSRRKFLQDAGALALGGLIVPRLANAGFLFKKNYSNSIGLQLYTLGNLMTTDPKGTLKQLAAIGYKELESAGSEKGNFYGFKPKELATMIKDAGMTWRSAHVGGAPYRMDQVLKMAKNAED